MSHILHDFVDLFDSFGHGLEIGVVDGGSFAGDVTSPRSGCPRANAGYANGQHLVDGISKQRVSSTWQIIRGGRVQHHRATEGYFCFNRLRVCLVTS